MSLVQTQQGQQALSQPRPSQSTALSSSTSPTKQPNTPASANSQAVAASTPGGAQTTPLGKWRHPRLDEVARRKDASTFGQRNLQLVLYGAAGLVTTVVAPKIAPSWLSTIPYASYASYPVSLVQLLLLIQLAYALSPLWRKQDPIEDIPLTPSQRKLLGLAPSSAPASPGSPYHTPPRVGRTTPRSGSPAGSANGSPDASLLYTARSASNSPASPARGGVGANGSPYHNGPASKTRLARKAMEARRLSGSPFSGSSAFLAGSIPSGSVFDVSTSSGGVSPSRGRNASVGLSNKWLYQKGREGSSALYT